MSKFPLNSVKVPATQEAILEVENDSKTVAGYVPPALVVLGSLEDIKSAHVTGFYDGPNTRWCRW